MYIEHARSEIYERGLKSLANEHPLTFRHSFFSELRLLFCLFHGVVSSQKPKIIFTEWVCTTTVAQTKLNYHEDSLSRDGFSSSSRHTKCKISLKTETEVSQQVFCFPGGRGGIQTHTFYNRQIRNGGTVVSHC